MKRRKPKKPPAAAKAKRKARRSPPPKPKRRKRASKGAVPPAHQAVSPVSGVAPPSEFQFKPGQSGNPAGRPSVGATLREWLNVLGSQELTEGQMRAVARDARAPLLKRAAAERLLRTIEAGDLADMEPLLDGEVTLEGLRERGVNTEIIKRIKVCRKTLYDGKEAIGEEVEREVELHDRAATDFDRVCDRTDGKPTQIGKMEVSGPGGGAIPIAQEHADPSYSPDQFAAVFERFTQGGGLVVVSPAPPPPSDPQSQSAGADKPPAAE